MEEQQDARHDIFSADGQLIYQEKGRLLRDLSADPVGRVSAFDALASFTRVACALALLRIRHRVPRPDRALHLDALAEFVGNTRDEATALAPDGDEKAAKAIAEIDFAAGSIQAMASARRFSDGTSDNLPKKVPSPERVVGKVEAPAAVPVPANPPSVTVSRQPSTGEWDGSVHVDFGFSAGPPPDDHPFKDNWTGDEVFGSTVNREGDRVDISMEKVRSIILSEAHAKELHRQLGAMLG